jgi:GTP-binding protein
MSPLWQARFFSTVDDFCSLPSLEIPEIAFAGRSNAGKSTVINLLCNQKKLAFVSKTPGRTRHINYFSVGGSHVAQHRKDKTRIDQIRAFLVDLPGYGYAKLAGSYKSHWEQLLSQYVCHRHQLSALVLIVDSRRLFTKLDIQMIEWFSSTGKVIHCILSKSDKLSRNNAVQSMFRASTFLESHTNKSNQKLPFTVQLLSALDRSGLSEANNRILELIKIKDNSYTYIE